MKIDNALSTPISSQVARTLGSPPTGIVAITGNDSTDLASPIRGFMVGSVGNVKATFYDGTVGTLTGLSVGVVYPGIITRIWSAGTTAGTIVGFY